MDIEKEISKISVERELNEHFLTNRQLFLWGTVDNTSAERLIKRMLFLSAKSDDDITLFINSPGGIINSGMAIYDAMQSLPCDIATVVQGQAASMASVLLAAGTPGKRYAWNHATVMIHQPLISGTFYGQATDVEIHAEQMLRVKRQMNEILAKHTGQDIATIERDTDRDNFMTAEQSKAYGLIDHVQTKR